MTAPECDGVSRRLCRCPASVRGAHAYTCECPPCPGCPKCRAEMEATAARREAEYRAARAAMDAVPARAAGPECDGTGRVPCRRCNGSGFVAVSRNQLVGCTTCMRRRYTLRCPGCPKCEARKAAMAAAKGEPRLF